MLFPGAVEGKGLPPWGGWGRFHSLYRLQPTDACPTERPGNPDSPTVGAPAGPRQRKKSIPRGARIGLINRRVASRAAAACPAPNAGNRPSTSSCLFLFGMFFLSLKVDCYLDRLLEFAGSTDSVEPPRSRSAQGRPGRCAECSSSRPLSAAHAGQIRGSWSKDPDVAPPPPRPLVLPGLFCGPTFSA